jgi:hypothetical protein
MQMPTLDTEVICSTDCSTTNALGIETVLVCVACVTIRKLWPDSHSVISIAVISINIEPDFMSAITWTRTSGAECGRA